MEGAQQPKNKDSPDLGKSTVKDKKKKVDDVEVKKKVVKKKAENMEKRPAQKKQETVSSPSIMATSLREPHRTRETVGLDFEAVFTSMRLIRSVIQATAELVDNALLRFGEHGISLQAADPANICLLQLFLEYPDSNVFEWYHVTPTGCRMIGVPLNNLLRILNLGLPDDRVTLRKSIGVEDTIQVLLQPPSDSEDDPGAAPHRQVEVDMKIMHLHFDFLELPDSPNITRIIVSSQMFSNTIRTLSLLSDNVNLRVSQDGKLLLQCNGETGRAAVSIVPQQVSHIGPSSRGTGFPLKYLVTVMKAAPVSDEIALEIQDDYPVSLEFIMHSGAKSGMRYFLAPRQEDDTAETADSADC